MSEHLPLNTNEITKVKDGLYHLKSSDLYLRERQNFGTSNSNVDRQIDGLVQARELFAELQDTYGIKHAGFYPVVAKGKNGQIADVVVSRQIGGEPCVDPYDNRVPANQKAAARKLLFKLTDYVEAKDSKNEPFLDDIFNLRQYNYIPDTDEMILVDMDPQFSQDYAGTKARDELNGLASQVLDEGEFFDWDYKMELISKRSLEKSIVFDREF